FSGRIKRRGLRPSLPPRTRKRSARTLVLAGRSLGTSRTTVGWPTIPTNSVTTYLPTHCDLWGGSLSSDAELELIGEYDEIEIPPVKPYVVRHRRFACQCQHCDSDVKAPAPAVATATPFGPRIHARSIYYKGFQALSYERLRGMFRDAFGLSVSEGALMNMFI